MTRRKRALTLAVYRFDFQAKSESGGQWQGWGRPEDCDRFCAPARRELLSPHYPLIGPYGSTEKRTLDYHARLVKQAGLDGLALACHEGTDARLLRRVAVGLGQRGIRVALAYRSPQRIAGELGMAPIRALMTAVRSLENLIRIRHGVLVFALDAIRWTAEEWSALLADLGQEDLAVSLVSDALGRGEATQWDIHKHALHSAALLGTTEAMEWKVADKPIWRCVRPGEDLTHLCRGGHLLPRDRGKTYLQQWREALSSTPAGVLIDSFNDWTRGTEIESSRECGDRYIVLTRLCADALRRGKEDAQLSNEEVESALTQPRLPVRPPRIRGLRRKAENPFGLSVPRPVLVMSHHWFGVPEGPFGQYAGWRGTRSMVDRSTGELGPEPVEPQTQWRAPGERNIVSADYPETGLYDTQDRAKLTAMVRLAKAAGIDGMVVDWGAGHQIVDDGTSALLEVASKERFWVSFLYDWDRKEGNPQVAIEEVSYLADTYGNHPWVFKARGKMCVWPYYADHWPPETWREIYRDLRDAGKAVFWITDGWTFGQTRYADPDDFVRDADGIGSYNPLNDEVVGAMCRIARKRGKLFSCSVQPGHDHTSLNQGLGPWLRHRGRIYTHQWLRGLTNQPDLVTITSWNEWHEGTEIEPSLEYGDFYLRLTSYFSRLYKAGARPSAFDHRVLEKFTNQPRI